jgi:hypothetical protein
MTIQTIKIRTAKKAFDTLEALTDEGNARFRGHREARWRLSTTLSRHFRTPLGPRYEIEVNRMISHFIFNLRSVGINIPFDQKSKRGRLEYARHYGLPSPLIDFTFSPYVALFFAFEGVRPHEAKVRDYSAVYCLNTWALADLWTSHRDINGTLDSIRYAEIHNHFKFDNGKEFEEGYPNGVLDYLELPASWNRRMQRQRGVFLYDSLMYGGDGFNDLEDFLSRPEINTSGPKILTKLLIPHSLGREIMERLEIMAITPTLLFESHEGAVSEVVNSFNYGRRTGRGWDD